LELEGARVRRGGGLLCRPQLRSERGGLISTSEACLELAPRLFGLRELRRALRKLLLHLLEPVTQALREGGRVSR